MIHNLKVLGLALVAIFAMSAMVASAASAASFTSESSTTTTLTGEEKTQNVFSADGYNTTCSSVSFHGELLNANDATATAIYTECVSNGLSAKVTGFGHYGEANTCDYVLHANGTADLECDEGAEVTIDVATCKVHIGEQTGLGNVAYTTGLNQATGKHDLLLDLNLTGIHAVMDDAFLCPFEGDTTVNNATLTGTVTVNGDDSVGNPTGITHDA